MSIILLTSPLYSFQQRDLFSGGAEQSLYVIINGLVAGGKSFHKRYLDSIVDDVEDILGLNRLAGDLVTVDELPRVQVRGKEKPLRIYRVTGKKREIITPEESRSFPRD